MVTCMALCISVRPKIKASREDTFKRYIYGIPVLNILQYLPCTCI